MPLALTVPAAGAAEAPSGASLKYEYVTSQIFDHVPRNATAPAPTVQVPSALRVAPVAVHASSQPSGTVTTGAEMISPSLASVASGTFVSQPSGMSPAKEYETAQNSPSGAASSIVAVSLRATLYNIFDALSARLTPRLVSDLAR